MCIFLQRELAVIPVPTIGGYWNEYFVKSRKACHREERSDEAILRKLQLVVEIQIASLRSQ